MYIDDHFTAAASGKSQAVELLLQRGADVNALNSLGQTPLFNAAQSGIQGIVVVSQDTDVQILCLHYWKRLASFGAKELWVTAGIGDSSRYIPTHTLAEKLGDGMCNVLPALHTLTGCDYTSKFGTKSAAVKATPVMFLKDF